MGSKRFTFIDDRGAFRVTDPEMGSYRYFPICNEAGMMSSVTPEFGGDAKTSQNTFVLEPVSSENLHNNKSTRNFWLRVYEASEDETSSTCASKVRVVSVTGASAASHAKLWEDDKDETIMYADLLSQRVVREMKVVGLTSQVTIFAPEADMPIELMKVEVLNNSERDVCFEAVCAVPLYARSAENIRDHKNVTSMLHRVYTTRSGVTVNPTMTFDERGHQANEMIYGCFAAKTAENSDDDIIFPVGSCPVLEDFIGEGGALDNPRAVRDFAPIYEAEYRVDGYEAVGALFFEKTTLAKGQRATYIVAITVDKLGASAKTDADICHDANRLETKVLPYLCKSSFDELLASTSKKWHDCNNVTFHTGDKEFDNWMYWVGIQPTLRRIYGCSFLPHHDYGKGGRGWRDLWQDCLALLLQNPEGVRQMLVDNFGGVRVDGTNATIIGSKSGEFIADRNGITRVWMDHAMWPFMTVDLYIQRSGDYEFLTNKAPYFFDRQVMRGEALIDKDRFDDIIVGRIPDEGLVIEHLLVQNLAQFYDVGEHGNMRLRGADWNDALDMAKDRGESVAFTAAYVGNYIRLAQTLEQYMEVTGNTFIEMAIELDLLMCDDEARLDVSAKRSVLSKYLGTVLEGFSGNKKKYEIVLLIDNLRRKAAALTAHIRKNEFVGDNKGNHWYNGYYDNHASKVEGGDRMMLTSQVFTIMSGVATDEEVSQIVKAADAYLYDESIGGYKLNSNFHEVKMDLGRMFGFAYGQKENGAVFCHMAVMYANSLYKRGLIKEGYKVIKALYSHAMNIERSGIYPGIPEYFDSKGRGVYHYLTGAGSWLLLTILNDMFGVKGDGGNLLLDPKLDISQFSSKCEAMADFEFAGVPVSLTYRISTDRYEMRETPMAWGITRITINGESLSDKIISRSLLIDTYSKTRKPVVIEAQLF